MASSALRMRIRVYAKLNLKNKEKNCESISHQLLSVRKVRNLGHL